MQIATKGNHYIWYCDWCDTRNMTPWVRITKNTVSCAACHKTFPAFEDGQSPSETEASQKDRLRH